MIELEEALARMLRQTVPLPVERVPVTEAAGRFLAHAVTSPVPLPLFDNSAFDGFAVRSADVARAAEDRPVWLRICGHVPAGSAPCFKVEAGTGARIFTGAMMPAGADAVVMQEDTLVRGERPDEVGILDPVKPWEAVRLQGEELRPGASLLAAGARLSAGSCGLLSAVGMAEVPVGRRPVVGLFSTGSELCAPGLPLGPGMIYESNRAQLIPLLRSCGAEVRDFGSVPDEPAATESMLRRCFSECDALVTSGGVSVGELDFVRSAFEKIGGTIHFWNVAVKPGKPFVFGDWHGRKLFGLPGNPVSSLVTFWLLVRPVLLAMQGAVDVSPPTLSAKLLESLHNTGHRRHFLRVKVSTAGDARPVGVQGSHALAGLAAANGLVDVPPDTSFRVGDQIIVLLLP
jgi:molybdopterin molybdotransferase